MNQLSLALGSILRSQTFTSILFLGLKNILPRHDKLRETRNHLIVVIFKLKCRKISETTCSLTDWLTDWLNVFKTFFYLQFSWLYFYKQNYLWLIKIFPWLMLIVCERKRIQNRNRRVVRRLLTLQVEAFLWLWLMYYVIARESKGSDMKFVCIQFN